MYDYESDQGQYAPITWQGFSRHSSLLRSIIRATIRDRLVFENESISVWASTIDVLN